MILYGNEVGTVLEKVITFLPKFEIYKNGTTSRKRTHKIDKF